MLHSIKVNTLHLFYELIRQDQIVSKTQTIQKPSNISTKKNFFITNMKKGFETGDEIDLLLTSTYCFHLSAEIPQVLPEKVIF